MKVRWFAETSEGKVREENEDFYLVDDSINLYIVCDGMGGHAAGRVASENAAGCTHEFILRHLPSIDIAADPAIVDEQMKDLVISAVQASCKRLVQMGKEDPELVGMGTTLTLLLIYDSRAIMGHVGDSRLYMKRRGEVHQLSEDHTLINHLVKQGLLTKEKAKDSPYSHVLTQCVGREENVQVDTLVFDLLPNDICLLCSDGFYHFLKEDVSRLEHLLPHDDLDFVSDKDYKVVLKQLLDSANEEDGSDNLTLIVVSAEAEATKILEEVSRRDEVFLKLDSLQQLYLFEGLPLQDLLRVVSSTQVYDCKQGKTLLNKGERGNCMYIIMDGQFDVIVEDTHLATLGPGAHFGEVALIADSPRTATVTCTKDARLIMLERNVVEHLIHQHKSIGIHLLHRLATKLSDRLIEVNTKLQSLENALEFTDIQEITLA